MQVKISVTMPVFNTEKYLSEAIESILNQSFKDFELLIVDDCSTDSSFEIAKSYAKKDPRIKLSRNEKNLGLVKTRNILLSKISSSSLYLSPMDSDDTVSQKYLQTQFDFLEKNLEFSVSSAHIFFMSEDGKKEGKRVYDTDLKKMSKTIFKKSPICHGASLIRISDWKKIGFYYNEDFQRAHDYELWSRFFGNGFKFNCLDEFFLNYRIFPNQGKYKHLKMTLWNTIKIQFSLVFKYRKFPGFSFPFYFFSEIFLLLIPKKIIIILFKILTFKKA